MDGGCRGWAPSCSGGRYDNLARQGNHKSGCGHVDRAFPSARLLHTAGAHASRMSPAAVLVGVWNEDDRDRSDAIADRLRARGITADVAPKAQKIGKQIRYASRLGIPYVWLPADPPTPRRARRTRPSRCATSSPESQKQGDVSSWEPDPMAARPSIVTADEKPEQNPQQGR